MNYLFLECFLFDLLVRVREDPELEEECERGRRMELNRRLMDLLRLRLTRRLELRVDFPFALFLINSTDELESSFKSKIQKA
jgi:hypothetical protein